MAPPASLLRDARGATLRSLQAAQDLLLAALRRAPRRYRLPPLPGDVDSARAAGAETALAFAIEAARASVEAGHPAPQELRDLFTWALGAFLRSAMAPQGGDPAFQALVLQAHDAEVRHFVRLSAHAAADRRTLRSLLDAVAHPGKTSRLPPGAGRERLAALHALASAGDWTALQQALDSPGAAHAALDALRTSPALQRLVQREALLAHPAVQRHLALLQQRGPSAGTRAAAAQGRSAAQAGDAAERITIDAFQETAALLQAHASAPPGLRVVRSLRPPAGFPGERGKAKDEWDAAIVCGTAILLLAEVKASPAAASSDFSRLHRGLLRLAQAEEGRDYAFGSPDGPVRIAGRSLRRLRPCGRALPAQVIYCCTGPAEAQPAFLAAASKAVLAAEAASLAFAQQIAQGATPADVQLQPVWDALLHAPRLRATLHQDATARLVREAMLHPRDLVEALIAQGTHPSSSS